MARTTQRIAIAAATGAGVAWIVAPFAWLVALALFDHSARGSFRLDAAFGEVLSNFKLALVGPKGPRFVEAFWTSCVVSAGVALICCGVALPVAGAISERGEGVVRNVTGAFLSTRLVPVTAGLPALAGAVTALGLPAGIPTVAAIYVLLFLPLACACIAAGDWAEARRTLGLLQLDAPMTRGRRLYVLVRSLAPDIAIGGLLVFLLGWSEFFIAMQKLDPSEVSLPQHLSTFQTIEGTEWGPLAGSLVLCLLPVVAIAILVGRLMRPQTLDNGRRG